MRSTRSRVQSSMAVNWSSGPATISWPFFPSIPRRRSRPTRALREVTETGIVVRITLHRGRVHVAHDHVAGLAVHIAAWVMAVAGGHQIVVSRTVRCTSCSDPATASATSVLNELKGVEGAWELYEVLG